MIVHDDVLKILIADDDILASMILRRNLEAMGHEVVVVERGDDAWKKIRSEDFHLVITELLLPSVSGPELCRRIRERTSEAPYTYVILLTARSDQEDRVECDTAGADDFLAKPFERGEMVARISTARRILTMREELKRSARRIAVMNDELQNQCAKLAEVASDDRLTGLKNRRQFHEILEKSYAFASRHQLSLSVVLIDIDHFRSYNDTFGHEAGDIAIAEIGEILKQNIREYDLAARYGGKEFGLILPGTDALGVTQFAERVRERIASRIWSPRPITASIGAATSSIRTRNALQLVSEADQALIEAKHHGRNSIMHFEEAATVAV